MNIESILISKDRFRFDNLISFMRSLVVKNEAEADIAEDTSTADAYNSYEGAYLQNDLATSYQLVYEDMVNSGITHLNAIRYSTDSREFQSDYMHGDILCKAYLTKLRKARVAEYTENNRYYRQFCGLPYDDTQNIYVSNDDSTEENAVILLHEVTRDKYPKTYNRLYYERDIEKIYENYNYLYLTFIENPMTPYTIRNKGQFEICYYKTGYLEDSELSYWFEAYETARNEILTIDYIEAFQGNYKSYVNIMYMFTLYYAFNIYCSKVLEKYSVRDYTDTEIYDILDSNGLGNLKTLNIKLLRRVVDRLPDLKTYIGTNKVIDILFDVVADDSLAVKRYYLNKKYNVTPNGETNLDRNKLYNESVDLVFSEKTINKGKATINSIDAEYKYMDIVMDDDTWGDTVSAISLSEKKKVKEAVKRELLSKRFSSIMTKYISITKIIDMTYKMIEVSNKLGLFYQFNTLRGNSMSTDKVIFNGIETTPLCLFAAWCIIHGIINGASDPDYIVKDTNMIEGIMRLRTTDKLQTDILELSNVSIDLGNGYTRKLGDYFTDQELEKYLVKFNYSSNTSVDELMRQYDENFEILNSIKDKLRKTDNYDEYMAWMTLYKSNMVNHSLEYLFGDSESYSAYIESTSPEFFDFFKEQLDSAKTKSDKFALNEQYHKAFSDYISSASNDNSNFIYEEDDIIGGEDISEIATLFNQFMSVYNQLLKQDYHMMYDDDVENVLQLLYSKVSDAIQSKDSDTLDLIGVTVIDLFKNKDKVDLELAHYIYSTLKSKDNDCLEYVYKQLQDIFGSKDRETLDFDLKLKGWRFNDKTDTTMSLSYELISDKIQ